jgi:hypothetical protein
MFFSDPEFPDHGDGGVGGFSLVSRCREIISSFSPTERFLALCLLLLQITV